MPIQDIALKTPGEQWTIETGGERRSRKSVLATRHDDDGDCPGFYSFEEIDAADFAFEKFLRSSKVFFSYFFLSSLLA